MKALLGRGYNTERKSGSKHSNDDSPRQRSNLPACVCVCIYVCLFFVCVRFCLWGVCVCVCVPNSPFPSSLDLNVARAEGGMCYILSFPL